MGAVMPTWQPVRYIRCNHTYNAVVVAGSYPAALCAGLYLLSITFAGGGGGGAAFYFCLFPRSLGITQERMAMEFWRSTERECGGNLGWSEGRFPPGHSGVHSVLATCTASSLKTSENPGEGNGQKAVLNEN